MARSPLVLAALLLVVATPPCPGATPEPPSWSVPGAEALERVPEVLMPPVDVSRLLQEDRQRAAYVKKSRVGHPMKANVAVGLAGLEETLPGGERLWRVRVRSPEALWLVLGFGTFRPDPGAELWVYDPHRSSVLGPFGSEDVREHGQLWMPPVAGDTLVVELSWPASAGDEAPNVHLGTVSHGYRPWGALGAAAGRGDALAAGACNIDVNCPLGDAWQDQKRAVVNLLENGSGFCSGSLVTNTEGDCRNYVLTAAHCVSSAGGAAGTTFQFNFERPGCDSGVAPTDQNLTGSVLRATYSPSDMTLLEMDLEPPEAFGLFYNGWSRSPVAGTESWCIHHPSNDEKKISFNEDPLIDGQNYGPDHWRVTEWEQGTTEGGSSGSPLYDQNQRVVGQLHGGTASCSSITWDEYGKLDVSWPGGGTPSTRLRDWLDPGNTGVEFQDGLDASVCRVPQPRLRVLAYDVDDAAGNADGVVDPGESFLLPVTLENTGTLGATGVSGTLTTTTPLVTITDGGATWPDIPRDASRLSDPPHFAVQVDPSFPCGDPILFHLVSGANEDPGSWESDFSVGTGAPQVDPVFGDDMESGANGWMEQSLEGTNAWVQTTSDSFSPAHSWFVSDISSRSDAVLLMPQMTGLPSGSELRFRHRYNTENSWDGGVLEYTLDGSLWQDAGPLITGGGYNSSIRSSASSNLAGRNAWAGDSGGWQEVVADLSSLAGEDVRFRWRFATDTSVSDEGWYLDDVVVDSTTYLCDTASGPASPGEAGSSASGRLLVTGYDAQTGVLSLSYGSACGSSDHVIEHGELTRADLSAYSWAGQECGLGVSGSYDWPVAGLPSSLFFVVVGQDGAHSGSYGVDGAGQERPDDASSTACTLPQDLAARCD